MNKPKVSPEWVAKRQNQLKEKKKKLPKWEQKKIEERDKFWLEMYK